MYLQRNSEALSCNYCRRGKAISIKYGVFLSLDIQHAMSMRRVILSFVACLALHYFSTLSHILRGKKILNRKCVLTFSITYV